MIAKNIIIQNKKICYKVIGDGKPVVLIHGFAEDSDVWKYQQDELSKHYKLIIPDLPGSTHSDIIEDMSIEGMAECIYQLLLIELQNFKDQVIMIGHSMGGYITLAFAEKHPEMLTAFGLFHSTAYADTNEKKIARQRGIEFIRTNGSYEFIKQSTPNLFSENYRIKSGIIVNNMIEQYKDFNPSSLTAYYQAMIQRKDRIPVIKSFKKPILFIIGKNDKAIPFEDSMQQCHLPQLSYIHILENTAHMGMWEEKEKSNSALASFLQDVYLN
jgi:pimeloyl-ACP methyl ester carboxylesterase